MALVISLSVRPSLPVKLVIYAQTVEHIDMSFAPYDRAMWDARSLCGSWASCYYLVFILLSTWRHEGALNTSTVHIVIRVVVATLWMNSLSSWSFARCRLLSSCRSCTQLSASARASGRGRQQPHHDTRRRPDGGQAATVASTPPRLQVVHDWFIDWLRFNVPPNTL